MDFFRKSDKVVEKLRRNHNNNDDEDQDDNHHQHHSTDDVSPSSTSAHARRRKKLIEQRESQNAMAPIDGNYSQMVKLFSNKEHEVTNLPTPDEIRVPLELYTVIQEKMINFRTELDEVKRDNLLLQRQHSADLDRMSSLTHERNHLAQALAAAKLRLEQVSQINMDLLKERDHHQGTSEALDNQVRYAQQEAEDRGQRLAIVLKDNDDLVGRRQWLEQQVIGLEIDRANQEKAATTAQTRLKLALLTATRLTSEKRNLTVALETIKDQLLNEQNLVKQLEEAEEQQAQVKKSEASPISGVAYLRNNSSLQEWIKDLVEQKQRETEEHENSSNSKRRKKRKFDHDEDEEQATDAEARAAAEYALLMAMETRKKAKKYYQAKLESMEKTMMENHELKSAESQRNALMSLAKSFASTTASPKSKHLNGDSVDAENDDDDDGCNEDGDTKLGTAMRALTQFSSGVPAHLAKMMADSMAKEAELKRKRHEAAENGEEVEISIDDDTPEVMKKSRRERRNLFGADDDDEDYEDFGDSTKNKTAQEKVASLLMLHALHHEADASTNFAGKSSKKQVAISRTLADMSPDQASSFVAQLLQSMNLPASSPTSSNKNNNNNNAAAEFMALSKILKTKNYDPMSRSEISSSSLGDASQNNNNNNTSANAMKKKPSFGTIQNLFSQQHQQNYQLGKSALFRKFFRDSNAEEEKAALEAATESIMTGVRTAETMIGYVDECTAQSLSLQDLRDRWEAIKHLVRARISETAAEARNFSREFYRLLSSRFQQQQNEGNNHNNNNNNTKLDVTSKSNQNNNNNATSNKPVFFFGGKGSANNNNNANTTPLPAQTKYYKANISSVVDSNNNKYKKQGGDTTNNNNDELMMTNRNHSITSSTSPNSPSNAVAAGATATATHKKIATRNVAISCNIQPRPETAHWCHNTLIQPQDLNEVDGALFALLPKIFFELHNVIHEVIREARQRAKVTMPIADPASFIGDGERRTIADVHCALKFDLFALMALRDLLRIVGRSQKGSVTSQDLRDRLIWYKECVESQRLAQLDDRFKLDPKLLHKLNIVDRQALVKYRAETTKRFRMPGTLQVPDSTVEIDGYHNTNNNNNDNTNDENTNNNNSTTTTSGRNNFDINAFLANQQQQNNLNNKGGSAYNVLFDDPTSTVRHPDFVKEMFSNTLLTNTNNENNNILWEVQQQLQQHILATNNINNNSNNGFNQHHHQHRNSVNAAFPPKKVHSFMSNISSNSNQPQQHQQQILSPSSARNNNNNKEHIPANVVVDPRMLQNNNHNLPPIIEKHSLAQTARNSNHNNYHSPISNFMSNNTNNHNNNNDNNNNNATTTASFHPTLHARHSPQPHHYHHQTTTTNFSPSPPKSNNNNNNNNASPGQRLGGAFNAALMISGFVNRQEHKK